MYFLLAGGDAEDLPEQAAELQLHQLPVPADLRLQVQTHTDRVHLLTENEHQEEHGKRPIRAPPQHRLQPRHRGAHLPVFHSQQAQPARRLDVKTGQDQAKLKKPSEDLIHR